MSQTTQAFRTVEISSTNLIRGLVGPAQAAGRFELFEYTMAPGAPGPQPHFHARTDETFAILEGRGRFMVDGVWHEYGPGEVVHVPKGTAHAFANAGREPLKMLVTMTPAIGFLDYFEHLAELIRANAWPASPEVQAELWARFDTQPAEEHR
ncbi:MAG: cupin domain-containing protein [Tepidisphaeraceae bacterium]